MIAMWVIIGRIMYEHEHTYNTFLLCCISATLLCTMDLYALRNKQTGFKNRAYSIYRLRSLFFFDYSTHIFVDLHFVSIMWIGRFLWYYNRTLTLLLYIFRLKEKKIFKNRRKKCYSARNKNFNIVTLSWNLKLVRLLSVCFVI